MTCARIAKKNPNSWVFGEDKEYSSKLPAMWKRRNEQYKKVLEDGCDETIRGHRQSGYRGCKNRTTSGLPCQKWTAQKPQEHSRTPNNPKFKNKGLGDHNYCRNPDNEKEYGATHFTHLSAGNIAALLWKIKENCKSNIDSLKNKNSNTIIKAKQPSRWTRANRTR